MSLLDKETYKVHARVLPVFTSGIAKSQKHYMLHKTDSGVDVQDNDKQGFSEFSMRNAFAMFGDKLEEAVLQLRRLNERKDKSDLKHSLRHFGMEEEWKFAAIVFDRVLLICFLVYLIVVIGVFIIPLILDSRIEIYAPTMMN